MAMIFNSGRLGPGTIRLGWVGVSGIHGLGATLMLNGHLVAHGYRPGDAVTITADLTLWQLAKGPHVYLGACPALSVVVGYPELDYATTPDRPGDGYDGPISVRLRLDSAQIEELEDRRQGKGFGLQIDAKIFFLPTAGSKDGEDWQPHPEITWQQTVQVAEHEWGQVLAVWERGLSIPVVVALPETTKGAEQAEIARSLREGLSKMNDGDYTGAMLCGRKSLEMLRGMIDRSRSYPRQPSERTVPDRIWASVDALFTYASAAIHADGATRDYRPARADAVAVLGGAASFARVVFDL